MTAIRCGFFQSPQDQQPTGGNLKAHPCLLVFNLHSCGKHWLTPTTGSVLACPCSKTQSKHQQVQWEKSSPLILSKAHPSAALFPVPGTVSFKMTEFPTWQISTGIMETTTPNPQRYGLTLRISRIITSIYFQKPGSFLSQITPELRHNSPSWLHQFQSSSF